MPPRNGIQDLHFFTLSGGLLKVLILIKGLISRKNEDSVQFTFFVNLCQTVKLFDQKTKGYFEKPNVISLSLN